MEREKTNNKVKVTVRFLENEHEQLLKCVADAGFKTINSYIRKMALNGYIIKLDLVPILEPVKLMRNISSSVNQIAARANATHNIYAEDITELKERYTELSESVAGIVGYIRRLEE